MRIEPLRRCWQNSLAGAILSEMLAAACRVETDVAYLAGLLRDIGRLALLVKYPEAYTNLLAVSEQYGYDLMATERDLFDVDHCQAGAWLAQKMSFPKELCCAVAHHHEPPAPGGFRMVHLVRIADQLADSIGFAALPAVTPPDAEEILSELPENARARLEHDPKILREEIAARISAWN